MFFFSCLAFAAGPAMFYVLGSVDDADETGISMFQRRSQPHDLQHRKKKRRRREDEEFRSH